ncbi:MAG: arylsulfatase [Caldilineaceae bacterium]
MTNHSMTTTHPNVVFVLTDDQGYGDLACHGNPTVRTPNLDQLHHASVRLTNYHVGPTCAPTRAGLLTGHYANSTGVWHTIGGRSLLRQNEVSMATFFAQAGYATGIFGKWHLGDNYPYRPQDRGFQEVVVHAGGGIGNTADYWGNNYFDDTYWTQTGYRTYQGYCTDIWFNEGLHFIERHRDRPFFCYIPTNAPHSPHLVAPRYSDPYLAVTPHAERAKYYGMVTNIDENVGILRQKLAEWGLAANTLLIFMTDNGSAGGVETDAQHFVTSGFNAGMRGQKNSEYDGGHRVPCFLHWPAAGLTQGRDIRVVTANVDILPTLIDLCALGDWQAQDFDGVSLAPLLRHDASVSVDAWPERALVTDSQRLTHPVKWRKSAVMTNRWRLVNGQELYDMTADPGQAQDIAADHGAVVAELRQAYEAWWVKVSQQFDAEIPIPLGDPAAPSVLLSSHDWRNEPCDCVWNQCQVRAGLLYNGYWEVDVISAGRYRVELRRWPREEDRTLRAGIPGPLVTYGAMSLESGYGGGHALPITMARLQIGAYDQQQSVEENDKGAIFTLDLPAGPAHLQSYFGNEAGMDLGAYYVYIDKLADAAPLMR